VTLGPDERRVRLEAGRAYFAVTRDPRRPFLVSTPAGEVRVTGTRFDVAAGDPAGLRVTVAEGAVEVRPAGAPGPLVLAAGDRFAAGEIRRLGADEIDAALAWRGGEVVFKSAALREVLDAFARHHGRAIEVSPGAGPLRFGGRFALDDLEGFLTGLEGSGRGLVVQRDPHGAVQVRLRSERP
jgi:transmembrane sensor